MNTKKKRTNSRAKGANGEREAAKFLSQYNLPDGTPVVARRMARNGQKGQADLEHNIPGVHFEVKRREGMDVGTRALEDAMEQAILDTSGCREPLVLWRRSRGKWRITDRVYNDFGFDGELGTFDAHEYLCGVLRMRLAT